MCLKYKHNLGGTKDYFALNIFITPPVPRATTPAHYAHSFISSSVNLSLACAGAWSYLGGGFG
jgi:hypothetical protein